MIIPREIVQAQIDHIETDFVPYSIEFESEPKKRMDAHFKNSSWENELIQCISLIGGVFDSWDTMISMDPDNPDKVVDVYGSKWTRNDVIAYLDEPVLQKTALQDYIFPTLSDFLTPEKEVIFRAKCEAPGDSYKVLLLGAGPFEYTWRLLGLESALEMMITDPDAYAYILDSMGTLLHSFIHASSHYPGDAVEFGDDWCDQRGCIMGPVRWREFFKPRLAELYAAVHKTGKKVVQHVCGSITEILPDLIEIGLDVVESVQSEAENMNPYVLKKRFGKDITFWGGLGCQQIVTFGTPLEIRHEIRKLRSEMSRGGGYILAPCKTLNSTVSTDNLLSIYHTFIEENYKMNRNA
jgi:uroporphyrinogen decarboxylase